MIQLRNNCDIGGFGSDYHKIRKFLLQSEYRHYSYGRWDFMTTHAHMDKSGLDKVAVWEENDEIVALLTNDSFKSDSWSSFCVQEGYGHLKKQMLTYFIDNFPQDGTHTPIISDTDSELHDAAFRMGFLPSEEGKEHYAIFPICPEFLNYTLPAGFTVSSLSDTFDLGKFKSLFLKTYEELNDDFHSGFTHADYERELKGPYSNLDIKIVVLTPNGEYAAYCGMWYDQNTKFAQVEPVGVIPDYRKLGLGKAAVLEGIKRCGILGAKEAQVDTNLQFYHNIGFRPYITTTGWMMKGLAK